jgi:putative flippase GtrA
VSIDAHDDRARPPWWRLARQVVSFAGIGVVITGVNAALYLLLRSWDLSILSSNAIAIGICTVVSTEANRRLTFAHPDHPVRRMVVQGVLVFAFYFSYNSLTIWFLHRIADDPTHQLEAASLVAAACIGGAARFTLMRLWVFRHRDRDRTAETIHAGP